MTNKTARIQLTLAVMLLAATPTWAQLVNYEMVTVGNPGNANDPATGGFYGAVNSVYQIGKYEVTIQQYSDFLNAVAKSDPYSLYSTNMSAGGWASGITRTGVSGSYAYSPNGPAGTNPAGADSPGNRPVTFVSWFDAARFANWMQNGQGSGSTETGSYTLLNGQTSGTAPARNPGATFYIATDSEWYKAAFYSPVLNSGSGGYYTYATQSNAVPGNIIGSGANQANYRVGSPGTYSVTQSSFQSTPQNYLNNVGAFTNSMSYYGTFDQSGNVWEVTDVTGVAGSTRAVWGGSWADGLSVLSSSSRSSRDPSSEGSNYGFRLVAVPEPSTYAMALAGLACGGFSMWRRRKRA